MLEIIFLIFFVSRIGKIVEARGYKKGLYGFMTVALWFGGEVAGCLVGLMFLVLYRESSSLGNTDMCAVYFFGLLGAGVGAVVSYLIASNLPVRTPPGYQSMPGTPLNTLPREPSYQQPAQPLSINQPEPSSGAPVSTARVPTAIADGSLLASYLEQAESLARSGMLEGAARVLEQGAYISAEWGPTLAGVPKQTVLPQGKPPAGYGLLVHLAGQRGRKDLAVQFFQRMLELDPSDPTSACQAALEAGIQEEAKQICRSKGIAWGGG